MSVFLEALILNSGLQRRISIKPGFMHLNFATEFEIGAVLLKKKNGVEDQDRPFLLKHVDGTVSAVILLPLHAGRCGDGL